MIVHQYVFGWFKKTRNFYFLIKLHLTEFPKLFAYIKCTWTLQHHVELEPPPLPFHCRILFDRLEFGRSPSAWHGIPPPPTHLSTRPGAQLILLWKSIDFFDGHCFFLCYTRLRPIVITSNLSWTRGDCHRNDGLFFFSLCDMASFDKGLYVYISRIQNIVSPVVLAFGVTIIGVLTDAPFATTFNTQRYIRLCGSMDFFYL